MKINRLSLKTKKVGKYNKYNKHEFSKLKMLILSLFFFNTFTYARVLMHLQFDFHTKYFSDLAFRAIGN